MQFTVVYHVLAHLYTAAPSDLLQIVKPLARGRRTLPLPAHGRCHSKTLRPNQLW